MNPVMRCEYSSSLFRLLWPEAQTAVRHQAITRTNVYLSSNVFLRSLTHLAMPWGHRTWVAEGHVDCSAGRWRRAGQCPEDHWAGNGSLATSATAGLRYCRSTSGLEGGPSCCWNQGGDVLMPRPALEKCKMAYSWFRFQHLLTTRT